MRKRHISDKELDNLLDQLSESVRSPKGKYTAENSFSHLQGKLSYKSPHKISFLLKYIAAASVVIILMLSTYFLLDNNHRPETITLTTSRNTKEVVLPDGSHVVLSHFSSLQYPSEFTGRDRIVKLSGEAYFDVTPNKKHPFSVHSGDICVTVLGTQFNVQAYSNDTCIKTTLIEGKVAVKSWSDHNRTTILNPNETAYFSKQTGELYKETNENAMNEIAWKEGKLIFENKPLAEIATTLTHYFNVQIKIDNQHLQAYKMTARFEQNENIEEIINILQAGADFKWRKEKNTIIINSNN
ncbi:MAG: DUF4974 domain-containing protein [Dysgonamonadaceae bacterium]